MGSKWLVQRTCSGVAALLALTAQAPVPAAAAEWVFRTKSDFCVEVDGAYAPDARLLTTDGNSKFLVVDLPSLSVSILVNVRTKKAVTIPPSLIKREATESSIRLVGPVSADAPASELSVEGPVLRFRVDKSEVLANMESNCQATVVSGLTGPITDDSSARKCVHLEDKPIRETAGCLKVTTMRNSCDAPVMVVVLSTQHLFSGDLPETSSIVIPPGGTHTLGCAWASGASAPTAYEVRAAAFLSKRNTPAGREAGSTGH